MFSIAKQIAAKETSFLPFVVAAVFYFIANYVVAFVMERIEKAFDYYK
jgi:ABC-type amino acid transport system permease subunit